MDTSKLHIVAATGFLKKDGKFLILKRGEKEIAYPGKWTVPGGKVEGADSIKETLKKEFLEEAGLAIKNNIEFFGESEFTRPDGFHVIVLKFICEYESGKVKIDKNDFTDYVWMSLDELENYDLIEGVKNDFKLIKI